MAMVAVVMAIAVVAAQAAVLAATTAPPIFLHRVTHPKHPHLVPTVAAYPKTYPMPRTTTSLLASSARLRSAKQIQNSKKNSGKNIAVIRAVHEYANPHKCIR